MISSMNKNIYINLPFMNLTSSALRDHFLSSIIPFEQVKKPTQIKKNSKFYKPEQFIWNNPHRTSKKTYKYYHQQNDQFNFSLMPKIQELETQDRVNSEQSRIQRLRNFRNLTREQFHTRKHKREKIQSKIKTFSTAKNYSTLDMQKSREIPLDNIDLDLSRNIDRTQAQFIKGVISYDRNLDMVKDLMGKQIKETHNSIRHNFEARRHKNQLVNSQIKRRVLTRSQTRAVHGE